MKYAKLIDDEIVFAPRKLKIEMTFEIDGEPVTDIYTVYNPTAAQYAAQGWLPVTYTDEPVAQDGYHMESSWEEQNGVIVQTWTEVEDEVSDEISAEEALEIIMGGAV